MAITKRYVTLALATGLFASLIPAHASASNDKHNVHCVKSVNNMPIIDKDETSAWNIGDTTFWTAPGEATTMLHDFASWFDRTIETVDPNSSWSWVQPQSLNGSHDICDNHSSATAIDLNATKHPFQSKDTFTPEQTMLIRVKLLQYGGKLQWGGNWESPLDEMHIEYVPDGVPADVLPPYNVEPGLSSDASSLLPN